MKGNLAYKTAIGILLAVIILQWAVILGRKKPVRMLGPVPPAAFQGKIAIVIDDWGYTQRNVPLAASIRYPLTMAVLPNLAFSRKAAVTLHAHGFEIILHLPMEPKAGERVKLEKNTIKAGLPDKQIRSILKDDLRGIPFALGVSNHMGSKATGDKRTMRVILSELKKAKLFFLDSVTADSVAGRIAEEAGVRFIKRDVFLDNIEEPSYIRKQLSRLKSEARRKGYAVGIGHDRGVTLGVLKDAMPGIEKEGYEFVFVSELAR